LKSKENVSKKLNSHSSAKLKLERVLGIWNENSCNCSAEDTHLPLVAYETLL